jgi:cholesterol transport system auxiliary component
MPTQWKSARTHKLTLLVVPPEVDAAYRSSEMAYSLQPYQIAYYSKNRWAETPAQMLHPLIIQTLQNTHYFHAVVSPSYIGRYDYLLKTQLMELQQDFTQHPAVYRIVLRAQMSSAATARVLAVKQFNVEVPVANNTPYSGVKAANRATVKLLRQLAAFSLNSIK